MRIEVQKKKYKIQNTQLVAAACGCKMDKMQQAARNNNNNNTTEWTRIKMTSSIKASCKCSRERSWSNEWMELELRLKGDVERLKWKMEIRFVAINFCHVVWNTIYILLNDFFSRSHSASSFSSRLPRKNLVLGCRCVCSVFLLFSNDVVVRCLDWRKKTRLEIWTWAWATSLSRRWFNSDYIRAATLLWDFPLHS